MVFSIVLFRQPSPALLFFKSIEVETNFPFANSISEFSRSQDRKRTYQHFAVMDGRLKKAPDWALFKFITAKTDKVDGAAPWARLS
jgi:hypothetical protein